ncbi:MAG: BACON domain-containing protein [Prevotella sp.]|nr:BACON domain-containing protein [Prevotellaceae bacterium]MDY5844226.1 BACON domain-containing protein [Prevotella sp.]
MKKIYSFLLLAAFTLAFSACSDDQDQVGSEYSRESTVKVTSSNLVFSAAAGTGTLVFEAPSTATVSVDTQWASAVVNGNKVDVSVKKNPKLEGRSALLTIKCGDDSTQVTVQQRGMMFKYGGETS